MTTECVLVMSEEDYSNLIAHLLSTGNDFIAHWAGMECECDASVGFVCEGCRAKDLVNVVRRSVQTDVGPVAIRQLRQLRRVTHHDDLISWEVCERLLHGGFVETSMGDYSCLTKAGVELCWALGLLDEKENQDGE